MIHGRERWGKRVSKACVRGGISLEEFDWKDDSPLGTPFSDMILYQLHVRGFTKHASSKVEHRGSFAGLMGEDSLSERSWHQCSAASSVL